MKSASLILRIFHGINLDSVYEITELRNYGIRGLIPEFLNSLIWLIEFVEFIGFIELGFQL